ncbi:hypothetical protein GCM10025779_15360 [Arthrobacter cryoconiti]
MAAVLHELKATIFLAVGGVEVTTGVEAVEMADCFDMESASLVFDSTGPIDNKITILRINKAKPPPTAIAAAFLCGNPIQDLRLNTNE